MKIEFKYPEIVHSKKEHFEGNFPTTISYFKDFKRLKNCEGHQTQITILFLGFGLEITIGKLYAI